MDAHHWQIFNPAFNDRRLAILKEETFKSMMFEVPVKPFMIEKNTDPKTAYALNFQKKMGATWGRVFRTSDDSLVNKLWLSW